MTVTFVHSVEFVFKILTHPTLHANHYLSHTKLRLLTTAFTLLNSGITLRGRFAMAPFLTFCRLVKTKIKCCSVTEIYQTLLMDFVLYALVFDICHCATAEWGTN